MVLPLCRAGQSTREGRNCQGRDWQKPEPITTCLASQKADSAATAPAAAIVHPPLTVCTAEGYAPRRPARPFRNASAISSWRRWIPSLRMDPRLQVMDPETRSSSVCGAFEIPANGMFNRPDHRWVRFYRDLRAVNRCGLDSPGCGSSTNISCWSWRRLDQRARPPESEAAWRAHRASVVSLFTSNPAATDESAFCPTESRIQSPGWSPSRRVEPAIADAVELQLVT